MSEKMSTQNLIDLFAERRNITKKEAELFVKEFFVLIEQALEDEKYLKIKGLGTFKLIDVESRESVNVNTGERFEIQGHTKITFVPEPSLRDLINKPFAHFETVALNNETILDDICDNIENESEEDSKELEVNGDQEKQKDADLIEPVEDVLEEETSFNNKQGSAEYPEERLTENSESEDDFKVSLSPSNLSVDDIIALEIKKADAAYLKKQKTKGASSNKSEAQIDKKSPISYIISLVIAVIVICTATVLYLYYPDVLDDLFSNKPMKSPLTIAMPDSVSKTINIPVDTFKTQVLTNLETKRDSIKESVNVSPKEESVPVKNLQKNIIKNADIRTIPVIPDSVNYIIVGTKTTYTIREGETLTRISLRFYGTKNLWPYIVKYNRDIIKNPNNVPYNTILKIPELKKK